MAGRASKGDRACIWRRELGAIICLVMTWLFLYGLVAPLQGPVARSLNGLDLSWLAGMLLYYALYRMGMVTPRAETREEMGEPSRVDRSAGA
jgi:hypothetical protein